MDSSTIETTPDNQSLPAVSGNPSSTVSHLVSHGSAPVINDPQVNPVHHFVETENLTKESEREKFLQERQDNETGDQQGKEKGEDGQKESEKALLEDDSVTIEIDKAGGGSLVVEEWEDAPTLPLPNKNKLEDKKYKEPPSKFLFPITRMKLAWTSSSGVLEFFLRATCIIFTSLGWLFCVGGFPFMSLIMLIIGSVFINDCPAKPIIPVYLIVSGVFGTLQHLFAVWTKYVPRDTESPGSKYRGWCIVVDFILQAFLGVWFIMGCVWVYGIFEPEYEEINYPGEEKRYCHKTVYLFTFWILNISFITLAALITFSFCCILFISSSPKKETVKE